MVCKETAHEYNLYIYEMDLFPDNKCLICDLNGSVMKDIISTIKLLPYDPAKESICIHFFKYELGVIPEVEIPEVDEFIASVKERLIQEMWTVPQVIFKMYLKLNNTDRADDYIEYLRSSYMYVDEIHFMIPEDCKVDFTYFDKSKDYTPSNKIYLYLNHNFARDGLNVDYDYVINLIDLIFPVDFKFISNAKNHKDDLETMKQTVLLKRIL